MNINLHKNATTTPVIRRKIQLAPKDVSVAQLACQFGVTERTIMRWRNREEVYDRPHTPHNLKTSFSEIEEEIIVELRKTLLLTLDDLLRVVREFLKPDCSRSALYRCLKRNGVEKLNLLIPQESDKKITYKSFKDYLPGFIHVDIKYLPKMPEENRSYLFVAIDRATRWVFMDFYPDKTAKSATAFLKKLLKQAPFVINKVLTDNGKEFTDRFNMPDKKPSRRHQFDQICNKYNIEHRLIKPGRPQTNGMVERFNGRIKQVILTTKFNDLNDMHKTLMSYLYTYNYLIPQRALNGKTPIEKLQEYYEEHPKIFKINPANQPKPNNYELYQLYYDT